MRLYVCPACDATLFFENLTCSCGVQVSYDPETDLFAELASPCANRDAIECNWRADPGSEQLCRSCAMTDVIPDLGVGGHDDLWREAEEAKRWLLANVGRWGWFKDTDPGVRPRFHLLAEETSAGEAPVSMGHADGLITINVVEVKPAIRVARREQFNERYRTMLGHFRHELAHFVLLERLSGEDDFMARFRALMGNEQSDYAAALSAYYQNGPAPGWDEQHITTYASSHPHEDWAETFAHVLHLTDMVDSLGASRLSDPSVPANYDAYGERDTARLFATAIQVSIAFNHVNRSMGLPDLYPFVLSEPVLEKFALIHGRIALGPAGIVPAQETTEKLPPAAPSLTALPPAADQGPVPKAEKRGFWGWFGGSRP